MAINKAVFCGRLFNDAKVLETAGGKQVVRFDVAVPDPRRDQQTGKLDYSKPLGAECSWWGDFAAKHVKDLTKGTPVTVIARMTYRSWEGDQGKRQGKICFTVEELEIHRKRAQEEIAAQSDEEDLSDWDFTF